MKDRPLWVKFVLIGALWFYCELMFELLILVSNGTSLALPIWANTPSGMRWLQVLFATVTMLLPAVIFAQISEPHPLEFLGFSKPNRMIFLPLAAVLLVLAFPFTSWIATWNENLHLFGGLDKIIREAQAQQEAEMKGILAMPRFSDMLTNLVVIAGTAALCEEVLFRGALQKLLIKACRGPVLGILLSSVLFSAMHREFLDFMPRLFLGIILGCMYWFSGSIWPGVLAHFVYNGFQVVCLYIQNNHLSSSPIFKDSYTFPPALAIGGAVIVLLGLVLMRQMSVNLKPPQTPEP